MADLTENPLAPDWGEVEKGNARAVSDALFLIWSLLSKPQPYNVLDGMVADTPNTVLYRGGAPAPVWSSFPTLVNLALTSYLDLSGAGAGQIKFPATQNPNGGANVLDDYERGTFTVVLGGTGGTSGQTYVAQVGRYVKFGNWVFIFGYVQLSAKGTITGTLQFSGFPFTTVNVANAYVPLYVQWGAFVSTLVELVAEMAPNSVVATLYKATAADITVYNATATADIKDTSICNFFGCYEAVA